MTIKYDVQFEDAFLVASVAGSLGLSEVAALHLHVLKSLAEQPQAVLLDLSDLVIREPLALAVFTAARRQAARWPGTPILLCSPRPEAREVLDRNAHRQSSVFDSLDAARRHLAGDPRTTLPSFSEELLPVSGAARHARDLASDACLRWDLPHLTAPASLIANELVSNVADHAHTMMTLRFSLRTRYLNIAVRDGSPTEVRPPGHVSIDARRGRGLMLVNATAHAWGCIPSADGKVVWASLRRAA